MVPKPLQKLGGDSKTSLVSTIVLLYFIMKFHKCDTLLRTFLIVMKLMVLENYNDNLSYKSYFLRRKMVMMHKIFNKLIVQAYNNTGGTKRMKGEELIKSTDEMPAKDPPKVNSVTE